MEIRGITERRTRRWVVESWRLKSTCTSTWQGCKIWYDCNAGVISRKCRTLLLVLKKNCFADSWFPQLLTWDLPWKSRFKSLQFAWFLKILFLTSSESWSSKLPQNAQKFGLSRFSNSKYFINTVLIFSMKFSFGSFIGLKSCLHVKSTILNIGWETWLIFLRVCAISNRGHISNFSFSLVTILASSIETLLPGEERLIPKHQLLSPYGCPNMPKTTIKKWILSNISCKTRISQKMQIGHILPRFRSTAKYTLRIFAACCLDTLCMYISWKVSVESNVHYARKLFVWIRW